MATEMDIEHLIDSCTAAISQVVYAGAGDIELIRTHVRAMLAFLAFGSQARHCYDTLDDLILYLTHREPEP